MERQQRGQHNKVELDYHRLIIHLQTLDEEEDVTDVDTTVVAVAMATDIMVAEAADIKVAEVVVIKELLQRTHLRSLSSLVQADCPVAATDNVAVAIDLILVVFVLH